MMQSSGSGVPNQAQLFNYINEISFSLNDTVLFLDSHPCDEDALAYYQSLKEMRNKALKQYTKLYGPLLNDDVTADNEWQWVMTPWPWEGGCQ